MDIISPLAMSAAFETVTTDEVLRFAAAYPLGWIVPVADPGSALLMPMLFETRGEARQPVSLLGHIPKASEAHRALAPGGRAVFLFLGPNAYIPPGWISKPGWVPTWNFVSLKVTAHVQVSAELTQPAVEGLVSHMQDDAGSGWTVDRIGPRYDKLLDAITGFRAVIETIKPRFKTGQDETEETLEEIRTALSGHPLRDWMYQTPSR